MKVKSLNLFLVVALLAGCKPTWKEFISREGMFSVLIPGTPSEQTHKVNTQVGPIDLHLFSLEQKGLQYLMAYNDYPRSMMQATTPEKILDGARSGVVANVQGRLISESKISLLQHPGRELRVKMPEGNQTMHTRIYLVNNRLYQVGMLTPDQSDSSKDISKFLNSFKLVKN